MIQPILHALSVFSPRPVAKDKSGITSQRLGQWSDAVSGGNYTLFGDRRALISRSSAPLAQFTETRLSALPCTQRSRLARHPAHHCLIFPRCLIAPYRPRLRRRGAGARYEFLDRRRPSTETVNSQLRKSTYGLRRPRSFCNEICIDNARQRVRSRKD